MSHASHQYGYMIMLVKSRSLQQHWLWWTSQRSHVCLDIAQHCWFKSDMSEFESKRADVWVCVCMCVFKSETVRLILHRRDSSITDGHLEGPRKQQVEYRDTVGPSQHVCGVILCLCTNSLFVFIQGLNENKVRSYSLATSLTPVLALYFPGQLNIFDHPPSSLERWKHTYISTLKHTVNLS